VLATLAGLMAFNEVPGWTTIAGIVIIIGALAATSHLDRRSIRRREIGRDRDL